MLEAWQAIADGMRPQHSEFLRACADTAGTQACVLEEILTSNAASITGRQFDFKSISTPDEFRRRVPIRDYTAIEEEIDAQTRGLQQLCSEPVRFYEQTGGSTRGAKLIPYTDKTLRDMRRAIYPWLADLASNRPGVSAGSAYWSISPAGRAQHSTPDGTAIGSASDLAFVDASMRDAFQRTLAAPPELAQVETMETWRYLTLWALLTRDDLSLISVWSPAFLTSLMWALPDLYDRLQADFRDARLSVAASEPLQIAIRQHADTRAAAKRLRAACVDGRLDTEVLWPRLDTISCWAHGSAARQLRDLTELFPQAFIQPKGLLATEGVVSVPMCHTASPLLAVRSGFFEFIDDSANSYLAHEVKIGQSYRVVMTNHSGLYRYDLGDRVVVTGRDHDAPMLEFVGRSGVVSDICGEKLCDAFVARCLGVVRGFALLTPATDGYCLYVDCKHYTQQELTQLAALVDLTLADNPQYGYARRLNELQPLRVVRIDNPAERYVADRLARGQKLGDVKPVGLCLETQWPGD